jgi:competence protein ComEC
MPLLPVVLWVVMAVLTGLLIFTRNMSAGVLFEFGWSRGILVQLLIVCCGCLITWHTDIRHHSYYFGRSLQTGDLLLVTIKEPLQSGNSTWRTTGEVEAIVRGNTILPVRGRLLLYLEKDTTTFVLGYGDQLLIPGITTAVRRNGNPGAFDYRQYCASQQIYQQVYLHTGAWQQLRGRRSGGIMRGIMQCKDYCLHTLQQYIGGKEAGLAAALLIGYRYDLDKEMVQDYTDTGIVHIIAISGMHLALIYGGLLWLMRWWPHHRFSDVLKGILIILLLWAFTLLTGGAASVLRATVMFTFITVGKFMLKRYTSTYNTLLASAFLLLCYDPGLLTDVGFQLSYLAVLSILICYRPLYYLLQLSNRWLDKLWDAVALTLAAQVLPLPVCLYYFHQFPVFFLPANLLAVPVSTVILYGEILLLLTGGFPLLGKVLGTGLMWAIVWLNKAIAWIGHWPGALVADINVSLWSVFFQYACIACLLIWWQHQWKRGVMAVLFVGLVWSGGVMVLRLFEQQRCRMVVYNIPGHTAVDIIRGYEVQFAGDSVVMKEEALYKRHLQPARMLYGVRREEQSNTGSFISLGRQRLVVVNGTLPRIRPARKFHTDYLLLSHNPHVDITQLEALFDVGCYIFDASNRPQNIQQWKSDCYILTLRFFSVPDQGAYVVNF